MNQSSQNNNEPNTPVQYNIENAASPSTIVESQNLSTESQVNFQQIFNQYLITTTKKIKPSSI